MPKGTTTQDPTAAPGRWFWRSGRRLATGELSTASSVEQARNAHCKRPPLRQKPGRWSGRHSQGPPRERRRASAPAFAQMGAPPSPKWERPSRGPRRACLGRHASAASGRVATTATAGEASTRPAAAVERLLIVLKRVRADPSPTGTSIRACGTVTGRRAADVLRHAIPGLSIGVPPKGAMVVLNQQPARRRARRDDPIALLIE